MKYLFHRIFITHWPRKLIAFLGAIVTWFLVSHSISITRTIPDVPIRIINLPADKTVVGLLPTGVLNRRIAVTLTGTKSAVEGLTPKDIEIIINAEGKKESWITTIDKKTLGDLSPEWDLKKEISSVEGGELFIKLSKLITEEIPVTITGPVGEAPEGYRFLDIWPKNLIQKVSGPEEQVVALKKRGLELTFNLNKISRDELDGLHDVQSGSVTDEISFFVPDEWKQIAIPFCDYALEPLNDPRAKYLQIDFIKQELVPLDIQLPISIFFPLKYSDTLNPQTYSLTPGPLIEEKNGLRLLKTPLYARDIGRFFLNTVKDNMQLMIIAAPKEVDPILDWTIEFVDMDDLENRYVATALDYLEDNTDEQRPKYTEEYLRNRFHKYVRHFTLFTEDGQPFELEPTLNQNTIIVS